MYTFNTHIRLKLKSLKIKTFFLHFQRNNMKTIFANNFSFKLDTFGNA